MNKGMNCLIAVFCGFFLLCSLMIDDEGKILCLIASAGCLVVGLLIKKFLNFLKNESARVTQSNKCNYPEELKKQVELDNRAKQIANLKDFDKYSELKPNPTIEAMVNLGAVFKSSVYQEKEKDWALMGGIANGLGGPIAGAATAARIMKENEEIRERNKKAKEWADEQSKVFTDLAVTAASSPNSGKTAADDYICNHRIDRTNDVDSLFSCFKFRNEFVNSDVKTGAFTFSVKWSTKGKKHIDGSLVALFYSKKGECVGCVYLPLPYNGTQDGYGILKGVCANPKSAIWEKVVIAPYDLWEIVPVGSTTEKIKVKPDKKICNQKVLADIESYINGSWVEQSKKRKTKSRKVAKIALITIFSSALLISGVILLVVFIIIPNNKYNNAVALMDSGEYTEAMAVFGSLDGYKDSDVLFSEMLKELVVNETISAGEYHTVGLNSDGTVVATEYLNETFHYDGQCDVSNWTDIVSVSAGNYHTTGLKSDGTVVSTKENELVSKWTDIVAISTGSYDTVGLKSDGTVVLTDENEFISKWTGIVAVSAGSGHTVGLKADGTVVAEGINDEGQCNVLSWTDIVAISAGDDYTLGLKSDGTVVSTNENGYSDFNVSSWTDIVAISAGQFHAVGLKSDGTVVATATTSLSKNECDVSGWTDIVAISAGSDHTIGLKSDGTVVATKFVDSIIYSGQCDVSGWTNIKQPTK